MSNLKKGDRDVRSSIIPIKKKIVEPKNMVKINSLLLNEKIFKLIKAYKGIIVPIK
tara:strand:+ start:60 stop:227 length:168 start_codon:yes stop_codon:yes gene_type:complete